MSEKIQKIKLWELQATKKLQQTDCGFLPKEVYKKPSTHRKVVWRQVSKETKLIPYMIKKFSSPKIKIWFEPMFFYGFFCGFERCGSAAFPNFRGGTSSPPQAAKCVRTIFRILHRVGKKSEISLVVELVLPKHRARVQFSHLAFWQIQCGLFFFT